MATKTIVSVVDDIDGSEGAETVTFSYRGTRYEIDLTEKNLKALDAALTPFVGAARKVGGAPAPGSKSSRSTRDSATIRAWAAKNGVDVPSRGRLPAAVVAQYNSRG